MKFCSVSDIRLFLDCRLKWYFSSPYGRNLTSLIRPGWAAYGIAFHDGLAAYYVGEDPEVAFLKAYGNDLTVDAKANEDIDSGLMILKAYTRWAPDVDDFIVIDVEQRHSVQLTDDVVFRFKYDGLVQSKITGKHWVLEHKTASSFLKDYGYLAFDNQMIAYQWGISDILGQPVAGSIYTFIKKKPPTIPKILKSGNLSQDSRMVTTYDVYLAAIHAQGADPAHYEEFLNQILVKEKTDYFKRYSIKSTGLQQQGYKGYLQAIAKEMFADDVAIYPTSSRWCGTCRYQTLCMKHQMGLDYSGDIEVGFKQAKPRD